ncbi:MAG: hypothetical protein O3C10_05025 [Chloroflexi bacterium]|nr:hypothetical protein [Chloroflexota bacterium]
MFAILDDETGSLVGAGTERKGGPEATQAEYSALFEYGQNVGWWRLWDELRSVPTEESVPSELVDRFAAAAAAQAPPTPTPVPSATTNSANFAADPEVEHVVIGRVSRKLGDVKLPVPDSDEFDLFSYWDIKVESYIVGPASYPRVTVVVDEGRAGADGVKFRGARFPVILSGGERVLVFLSRLPVGSPPLGSAAFAIPAVPGTDGIHVIREDVVDVVKDGKTVEVDLEEFLADVERLARLAGKRVERSTPLATATPAPRPAGLLSTATAAPLQDVAPTPSSLAAAVASLPSTARVQLADDVVEIIPGLAGPLPAELDPAGGTLVTIYHIPSGSRTWFLEPGAPVGRSYMTLEAIEALEGVLRDARLMEKLRERLPG